MARPAKPISAKTAKIGREETERRLAAEKLLLGGSDKLVPPEHLTDIQKEWFEYIVDESPAAKNLGNCDLPLITRAAFSYSKEFEEQKMLNENPSLSSNNAFMSGMTKIVKMASDCDVALGMSPQSRAKMSIAMAAQGQEKKKTLIDMINDDEDADE